METRQLVGILLIATGGTLFLDSAGFVLRIFLITSWDVAGFWFGSATAFVSLLLVGPGLYFLFEPAITAVQKTSA